ncbi:MAG: hypothetical protein EXR75_04510 [Myxococcales bacterium]|nr:hypothetical protein [Myxococcales bacterium]
MLAKKRLFAGIVAVGTTVLLGACIVEETVRGESDEDTGAIDDYLLAIPHLPVADSRPKGEVPCDTNCPKPAQDGEFFCSYKRYSETIRFDRFVAFQPNSATMWPGTVVRGGEAQYGILTPLSVELAPVTFSLSLENLNANPTGSMAKPSLSAFREERNRILAEGVTGATPASIDFEIMQVHSESQIALSLGAGVDWPGAASVTGNFDFTTSEKKTHVLVNFTQAYYTIDVDAPTRPSQFFSDAVTLDQLEKQVGVDNPPMYLQSITFGRRVIFSVESSEDAKTIKAALEAAVTKAVSVDASVSATYQKALSESTIRAYVIGGSGADATGVVSGFEGIVQYIKNGGNYSKESPGAPIAYKLAYLDNQTAQLAFTSEYNERQCEKTLARLRVEVLGFDHLGGSDVGGNLELHGNVSIRFPTKTSGVTSCTKGGIVEDMWSMPDDAWIDVPELMTWEPKSPIFVSLHDVPVTKGAKICLFSHLVEEDSATWELSGDDDFGNGELLIWAEDGWHGEHMIQVRGNGNEAVDVRVRIDVE